MTGRIRTLLRAISVSLLIFSTTGTIGCATSKIYRVDDSLAVKDPVKLRESQLHIGIMPFTYSKKTQKSASAKDGVKQFESHFFGARLAQTMRSTGWFAGVYCLPSKTPSVDILVYPHVKRSDGEVTEIEFSLFDPAGNKVGKVSTGMNLSSKDFSGPNRVDPGRRMWLTASNRIARALTKSKALDRSKLDSQRVAAYLEDSTSARNGELSPSSESESFVAVAVDFERKKLLAPVTRMIVEQGRELRPAYRSWQERTTKLFEAKRQKQTQSIVMAVLSVAAMGANTMAVANGVPASSMQQANLTSATGMMYAAQAGTEATHIGKTAYRLRNAFGQNLAPLTIKLGGAVYTLTGSVKDQLGQMRRIIRKHAALGQGA